MDNDIEQLAASESKSSSIKAVSGSNGKKLTLDVSSQI